MKSLMFSWVLVPILLSGAAVAEAEPLPFLHPLFADNMVLQQGIAAPVWGWAAPGEKVTVRMEGKSASATALADGKWLARLGPFAAGGPFTLEVAGPRSVTVKNVLVGDVWICSGQSNMEMGIGAVDRAQEEIAGADIPGIRLFTVPKLVASEPQSTCGGEWLVCSPKTVAAGGWAGFTAVGYFFGREIHSARKVPVGLIHTSWGGTIAEAWTSGEALSAMDDFRGPVEDFRKAAEAARAGAEDLDKRRAQWFRKVDPGSAPGLGWADPAFDASLWKAMSLPANWESAGLPDFDGIVWFRREFTLPEGWAGKDCVLHLGPIDDADTTWVNGVLVGSKDQYNEPRDYKVPAKALKAGRNVIAVRAIDFQGPGGICGSPADLRIEPEDLPGVSPVSLAGPWLFKDSTPVSKAGRMPQRMSNNPNVVTVLYNGMIAPLLPFAIQGAIWYQGESNAGRAAQYRTLLPTMIQDWRARFGVGEFPFFIVQLANFMAEKPEPGESAWAELREAQALTAQRLPKTGIGLAIDIGDAADIHPRNKQDVGKRLAVAARAIAYGEKIEYSGPIYAGMQREGGTVRLRFDHAAGLTARGGKLQGFAIAGEDGKFVWADASIDGSTVVLASPKVTDPRTVRYGWADNPVCTLYNAAGLPAVPFRTDAPAK